MIEIKEVLTYKQKKAFVDFPIKLYKNNPYFVPCLRVDEMNLFNPKKNVSYEDSEAKYFLAYKDKKVVGRIAGIVQHLFNDKTGEKRLRFSRFDSINDQEVANALFAAVENYAKEVGMEIIHGPLGFNDLEREGLLVEGFDELSTFEADYSFPYYAEFLEKLGYAPEDITGGKLSGISRQIKNYKKLAEELDLPNVEEVAKQCIGITVTQTEALFQKTYGKAHPCESYVQAANDIFYKHEADQGIPEKPGVHELFVYLKKENYRIGLASSTKEEAVRRQMKTVGILDDFDAIVCGDMVTKSKPDPDIYLKACELLKVDPKECYAVEDSYNGIRSAHAAGMKAIMIPDLLQPTPEILELTEQKLDSLLDLKDFLESQKEK